MSSANRKARSSPRYESILEQVLREIAASCEPGARFHTQRDLMRQHNASYATIGRVLRELKSRGIISTHTGKGIFIQNLPDMPSLKRVRIAVFSTIAPEAHDNTIAAIYQKGLLAGQDKFNCELVFLSPALDADDMLIRFRHSRANGIVFLEDTNFLLQETARQNQVPYVVVHPVLRRHDFAVEIDDFSGIHQAVSALSAKGAENILLVSRNINRGHNREKADAFLACLKYAGLRATPDNLYETLEDCDLSTKIRHLRKYLQSGDGKTRYDAIFTIDPTVLEITESALVEAGISVPHDVLLAVFGFHGYARRSRIPLGVVEIPHAEAALTGIEILLRICHNRKIPCDIRLLKTRFRWL